MTTSDERTITRSACPVEQLPWLANGSLSADERPAIEAHLAGCSACQAEMRALRGLRVAMRRVSAHTLAPRSDLFALVESRLEATSEPIGWAALARRMPDWRGALRVSAEHVAAQGRLIRRELFWAPLFIVPLVVTMVYLPGPWSRAPAVAALAAALVTALGMALLYGQRADPACEITLATPTSPGLLLGIRCGLVFGYDLALNCGLILPFLAWRGVLTPGWFLTHWLAPLCCLSAIALLLSVLLNANAAILICLLLWALRVYDGAQALLFGSVQALSTSLWQQRYEGFWSQGPLLFLLTTLAVALAFVVLERKERYA
ncbi:MAG: anti-sigma factor family protein [Ktedonobacterales bacterium]